MKQSLLESFGFSAPDKFPVFADRFPIQLLSYLRLSRIQDPLLFTKVSQQTDMQHTGTHTRRQHAHTYMPSLQALVGINDSALSSRISIQLWPQKM
jgi:hypothetical protein